MKKIILGSLAAIVLALPSQTIWAATNANTTTVTYPYYGFVEDPENPWETVWDALDETGTVEYSDDFFTETSPGEHPKLRALSYALALAGYENEADGYPSTSTEKNPKLTNLLNQMGFSDYQTWDTISEEEGHSMGTTIGHKTLNSGEELIVIAPRNYNYMTEWLSNFNVGTRGDHAGFSESADLIVGRFNQYLSNRSLSNYKVWVVGYSRGGAVVDLFAKNINKNLENYNLNSDDFYAYTFGAPRASTEETKYTNIHDVKDGNDLILGFLFPEIWGFYNTGVYEEIHPADLIIKTSVVDVTNLVDGEKVLGLLSNNDGMTKEVGEANGRDFMNDWLDFVTANGLTREYFDTKVKAPLSKIMQAYQLRTLDKQSDLLNFISSTEKGMLGKIAGSAFMDLIAGGYPSIAEFPTYQAIVKIVQGTAENSDIEFLTSKLTSYIGNYNEYAVFFDEDEEIPVTETEFETLKTNLPELIKVLLPIIVADAKYTRETYGENYSLYYTYTLGANAEKLVYGHIPESIMPILKSLIPADSEDSDDILIPDSGYNTKENQTTKIAFPLECIVAASLVCMAFLYMKRHAKETK